MGTCQAQPDTCPMAHIGEGVCQNHFWCYHLSNGIDVWVLSKHSLWCCHLSSGADVELLLKHSVFSSRHCSSSSYKQTTNRNGL